MRFQKIKTRFGLAGLIGSMITAGCVYGQVLTEDPPFAETFFAAQMPLDASAGFERKAFTPDREQAGFNAFAGVANVRVEGGALCFSLTHKTATLGWGNHESGLPVEGYELSDPFSIELESQSSLPLKWTAAYKNGMALGAAKPGEPINGCDVLMFANLRTRVSKTEKKIAKAIDGGIQFVLQGEVGTEVTIKQIKTVNPKHKVWARREFMLPPGKVWRAVVDVSAGSFFETPMLPARLHVNGHVFDLPVPIVRKLRSAAFDIAPWLVPGQNVVGIYVEETPPIATLVGMPHKDGIPHLYLQTRIVMEGGEMVQVTSDKDWRYGFTDLAGWDRAGFDDSAWNAVTQTVALTRRHIHRGWGTREFWMPAYQGRLVLANPAARDLVFAEKDKVLMDLRLPGGLAQAGIKARYAFGRCKAGVVEALGKGLLEEFQQDGNTLKGTLDLGKLEGGVYVCALDLLNREGHVMESRPREPFVVIPDVCQKTVVGNDIAEGLDLELETEIDFTDAAAPFENFETCPADGVITNWVVVDKPGLRYREVSGWRREAGFAYRIEFKYPGDFYLMEVEYPDDTKRIVEVLILGTNVNMHGNSQSASGAETGGRHLPTGTMQTLQWLHVADPGVHMLAVVNHRDYEKAAARGVKIYRVKGRLPKLELGAERVFGPYAERTAASSGAGNVFGVGRIGEYDNPDAIAIERDMPLMAWQIYYLEWFYDTFDRYTQYLKFSGRDLYIMGCYQYRYGNTPFLKAPAYDTWRVRQCPRRLLAHFFDKNGIGFYSEVEWEVPIPIKPAISNSELQAGEDTLFMVDREGQQLAVFNWLHPQVRGRFLELMSDLLDAFGDLPGYRGIHTVPSATDIGWKLPAFIPLNEPLDFLRASYDDVSLALFEKDTGVKLGIDPAAPDRFQQRARMLEQDSALREKFIVWRGIKTTEIFADVAGLARAKRADLNLALVPLTILFAGTGPILFENLDEAGLGLEEYLRLGAINVKDLGAIPGAFVGRWAIGWLRSKARPYNSTQDPYVWLGQTSPLHTAFFNRYSPDRRYVMMIADWNESFLNLPENGFDWARSKSKNRKHLRVHSQFGGFNAREPITQALIVSDPNMIVLGVSDLALPIGHDQALRSVTRIISYLPQKLFEPVLDTGLDSNLAVRRLQHEGATWFYVANPCQWPVKGTLRLTGAGNVSRVPDGERVALADGKLAVELEPFGLLAFKSDSTACAITEIMTEPLDQAWRARIEGVISAIRAYIAEKDKWFAAADKATLKARLSEVETLLSENKAAAAWLRLTAPEVWRYYVYEPSCDARLRKPLMQSYFSENKVVLPPSFRKTPADEKPRVLKAMRLKDAVKVDGELTEAVWQNTVWGSDFFDWKLQSNSVLETGVAVAYDDNAIYLAFVCADPDTTDIQTNAGGREHALWSSKDDALGFFLYPAETGSYYHFGFNTAKARFDQQVVIGGKKLTDEYNPKWQRKAARHDGYWSAEVRIPWQALNLEHPPAKMNANFFRAFRGGAVDGGDWSPTSNGHNTAQMGIIVFE